jgi:uncharacterized PurR-regulated membrane protein YhhQ (DUF165 family)
MRLRRLSDKPLQTHTKVGFVVAAVSFLIACLAGHAFGLGAIPDVLFKGLIASFVLSFLVGLFTKERRPT